MKVREERALADRKLAKSGGQIDELLAVAALSQLVMIDGNQILMDEIDDGARLTARSCRADARVDRRLGSQQLGCRRVSSVEPARQIERLLAGLFASGWTGRAFHVDPDRHHTRPPSPDEAAASALWSRLRSGGGRS